MSWTTAGAPLFRGEKGKKRFDPKTEALLF
jgi:hypothetical protein